MPIVSNGATFTSSSAPFEFTGLGPHPLAAWLGAATAYDEIYRRQLWPNVAINKLVGLHNQLPKKVYRRAPKGREDARDSPFGRLIATPSPVLNPMKFWGWYKHQHHTHGISFARKIRDRGGRPVWMELIHPTRMRYGPAGGGLAPAADGSTGGPSRWWLLPAGGGPEQAIPRRDLVIWSRLNSTDPFVGMSPLEPLRETLENEYGARRANAAMWRNGGKHAVVLRHPGRFNNPKVTEALRQQYAEKYAGVDNWGKPLVLQENMEAVVLPATENLEYIQTRKLNREEVAAEFDLPPNSIQINDRSTFCLPAEASISTLAGPKPIVDVRPGDWVYGFDGDQLVPARVGWSGQTGELPTFRVRTANRTLVATGNHPVLVLRRPHLHGSGNRARYGDPEPVWVRVDELTVGDLLVAGHGYAEAKGGQDLADTDREITVELMEFCGLLLGDGWMSDAAVKIAHADHARYIDHYLDAARRLFTNRSGGPVNIRARERCSTFSSASAVRELRALGFGGDAYTKRVPGWVFTADRDLRLAFLRGFIDADGSVCAKGRIAIGLCNQGLRDDIWELCMGLGIPVTNRRTTHPTVTLPNGRRFDATAHWINLTDPGANIEIGSHDPQDAERLAAGKPFSAMTYKYADRAGRTMAPPIGGQLSKVTGVEATGETVPVYDLTVPGVHSFLADGLVVHNSNVTEQNRQIYRQNMPPHLQGFEAVIDFDLRDGRFGEDREPDFGEEFYFEALVDGVMRGSYEERIDAHAKGIQTAQVTPAEVRDMENRPFVEGSDTLLINAAVVPIQEASRATAATVAQPLPDDGTTVDSEASNLLAPPVVDAQRAVMGRLGRIQELADIDPARLVEGLDDGDRALVLVALHQVQQDGGTVPELRNAIKQLMGDR